MYLFLPPFSFSLTLLLSLSLRLPFYILFVYIGFIYIPVVGTWRLHWAPGLTGALGRAAASGITGMLFYAPFDLAGAKFLWWTWHDNDAAVDARWCGVPVGSTMWTLVHGFCFHMLVYWCGVYEPLEIPAAIAKQVDVRSMKNAAAAADAAAAATAALKALSEGSKKVAKRKKKATKSATPPAAAAAATAATNTTSMPLSSSAIVTAAEEMYQKVVSLFSTDPPVPVQTPTVPLSNAGCGLALFVISVVGTPLMMVAMGPFQMHQLRFDFAEVAITQMPGRPDHVAIMLAITLFVFFARRGLSNAPCANRTFRELPNTIDAWLLLTSTLYFAVHLVIVAAGTPESVVATGVHQVYGDCGVKDVDLMGYQRTKYLCKESYEEDFHFNCVNDEVLPPEDHPSWFTVCGKGWRAQAGFKLKFVAYMVVELGLCLTCFGLLVAMYMPALEDEVDVSGGGGGGGGDDASSSVGDSTAGSAGNSTGGGSNGCSDNDANDDGGNNGNGNGYGHVGGGVSSVVATSYLVDTEMSFVAAAMATVVARIANARSSSSSSSSEEGGGGGGRPGRCSLVDGDDVTLILDTFSFWICDDKVVGVQCAEKALLMAQMFSKADDALFIKHLARVLRIHPQFSALESAEGNTE